MILKYEVKIGILRKRVNYIGSIYSTIKDLRHEVNSLYFNDDYTHKPNVQSFYSNRKELLEFYERLFAIEVNELESEYRVQFSGILRTLTKLQYMPDDYIIKHAIVK